MIRFFTSLLRIPYKDFYMTIIAGISAILASIFGWLKDPVALVAFIASIITLISFTLLNLRKKINTIHRDILAPRKEILLREFPIEILEKEIDRADSIFIIGVMLDRLVRDRYTKLEKKLISGASIRLLLVDPDDYSADIASIRPYTDNDPDRLKRRIKDNLISIKNLKKITSGDLMVRLIKYPNSIGGYFINTPNPEGVIFLAHYSFKMRDDTSPKLVLSANDGYWYSFFSEQAEVLWNNAEDYSLA